MTEIQEAVDFWDNYFRNIGDWEARVEGVEPKAGGCGLVYELPSLSDRPDESVAIADMRELELSEPHKHSGGETEMYFVLRGAGKIAVGSEISSLYHGVHIVTPPATMHITLPRKGLVLGVVNTPPFDANNYVAYRQEDPVAAEMIAALRA